MTRHAQGSGIPPLHTWKRAELSLAGVLLLLAVGAWLLTGSMAMPGMRMGILTGTGSTSMSAADPVAFVLFLVTWVVMMAAMMLPAIIPFTVGVSRLMGARPDAHGTLPSLTAGYLLVWSAVGVLAYFVVRGFDALGAGGTANGVRAGAVVLLVAGAYQFSPLKQWCLVRCRSPFALVLRYGSRAARSRRSAVAVGVNHGGYCLGCCWALMLVLLAAGVMSLAWMAAIAAVITVEKVAPGGKVISYALGAVLIGLGATLLAAPGVVSAM
ncbi:hypothetical protein GCM10009854_05430 [Saccharopolyspora halophila]|uniref:DUF2182 domain-containing protein n=1 Tax=Saccharopolyspora halophila TaxID=405551 RepID=A0ABN3FLU1_9PSEU